jgi:hypothetical protein
MNNRLRTDKPCPHCDRGEPVEEPPLPVAIAVGVLLFLSFSGAMGVLCFVAWLVFSWLKSLTGA